MKFKSILVDECVEQLRSFIDDFGIADIVSMAAPPGLRLEQMAGPLRRHQKGSKLIKTTECEFGAADGESECPR